jgi:hypothetical protein
LRIEPILIPSFDRELVAVREPSEERDEPIQKMILVSEDATIKERELQNHGAQLSLEDTHRIDEQLELKYWFLLKIRMVERD